MCVWVGVCAGIHTGFFRRGGGRGKCKHWPVVLSQTLLCVVEMCSFFIKCIDEKTKRLSSKRMMLYITKMTTCQNFREGNSG